jgi:hypothetical protein
MWRKLSVGLTAASALLLAATLVLPGVGEPQVVRQQIPPWQVTEVTYQIHGYGIPTVTPGTVISVTLSGFQPGELEYVLSPVVGNNVLQPLAFGKVGDGPDYNFTGTAQAAYSLEMTIIAYNGSGFNITFSGVWSPFDFLRVYTAPSVFLLTAGLAMTYYFGTRIPRQLAEEKVEAELEEVRKSGRR